MAYPSYANIILRVRELIEGTAAAPVRPVTADRFVDDLVEGLSEEEAQRRSMQASAPFNVRIQGTRRHPLSPPINSNVILEEFDLVVTVSRLLGTEEHISETAFADVEAASWQDAAIIRQSLETPPNMAQTEASAATGIVGGAVRYTGSLGRVSTSRTQTARRYVVEHNFTGIVKSSPAV